MKNRNYIALGVMLAVLPGGLFPPPIKDCRGKVTNIFWHTNEKPAPEAPQRPRSCAVIVEPSFDSWTFKAPYSVVDPDFVLFGVGFWIRCAVPAIQSGRTLPVYKITQDPNDSSMSPELDFILDTPPVLGRGEGHYLQIGGTDFNTFRKAYIRAGAV